MCCRYYVESSERTQELIEQMPLSLKSRWEHLKDASTGKEKTGDKYILQTKDKDMTFSGEILIICSIEIFERTFYNEFMNEIFMVPSLFKFMYGGFYKSTFSFTFL